MPTVEKSKPPQKPSTDRVEELRKNRERVQLGGGQERIDKQHAAGKLTARERIDKLVDRDSFQEVGLFAQHRATYFGMADKEMPADGV
ncbi:MAG TPA: carboxyl transferase domain-containing protein, partial [Verrucomicrobiae bacterium]|nr:carboxyl transferase domain-containing protein [Verrucomicrobiae bacterium]